MPDGYMVDEINDLVVSTLRRLRPGFVQLKQKYVNYEVFPRWFKTDKVVVDGGRGLQETLMDRGPNVARFKKLYQGLNPQNGDHLASMNVPWTFADTHWGWVTEEMLINTGESRITKIIEPRELSARLALIEMLEDAAWSCPTLAQWGTIPAGLPYYVVKNSTAGFNGGLPADHTTVAGVSLTDHPNYANWTDQYVSVSEPDLLVKMENAVYYTNFKAPVTNGDYEFGEDARIYCGFPVQRELCRLAKAQNDNIGYDLSFVKDTVAFKRLPIIPVQALETDTSNPVYGINHSTFKPYVLKGDYMRRNGPIPDRDNPDGWVVILNMGFNFLCLDRRRNWVISL
jgi:hypothetical protein